MGEAKRRGNYAARKAAAIKAGRVKVERKSNVRLLTGPELMSVLQRVLGPSRRGPDA